MAEEVKSKAAAASSTANRSGVPSQNRLENVDVPPARAPRRILIPCRGLRRRRLRHVAGLRGPLIEVWATIYLMRFHEAPGNSDNHRKMNSHSYAYLTIPHPNPP